MEILKRTPRAITPEEKKKNDEKYRITVAEFGKHLQSLVKVSNALFTLAKAIGQAGKGSYLAFPNPSVPGEYIQLTYKHIKSSHAYFNALIKDLKNYLRVSKKKTRDQVKAESLSGTYTPVYATDVLRLFFTSNPERFGSLEPAEFVQSGGVIPPDQVLINNLPFVKDGYLLRNTSTMLFYIYAHVNNLQAEDNAQYARSDELMDALFGGEYPATNFSYKGQDGKIHKMLMTQAVETGLIPQPYNTYDVISMSYPVGTKTKKGLEVGFTKERFNTYYYQNIAAANYFTKAVLNSNPDYAAVANAIAGDDVRQGMLNEHNLVKTVSEKWKALLEPGRKIKQEARKKERDAIKKANKAAGLV